MRLRLQGEPGVVRWPARLCAVAQKMESALHAARSAPSSEAGQYIGYIQDYSDQ